MIDFHSHILPEVDDGSESVKESIALLTMLKEQGINTVVATPHFDKADETIDAFIERRDKAYDELRCNIRQDLPKIICGAEVGYYSGISRNKELLKLCVGNSHLLLLEMPYNKWSEYTIKELFELMNRDDVIIVLAHVGRYLHMQKLDTLLELNSNGLLMQCNASFFLDFTTRRKAISMLKNGNVNFIGSDCHNLTSRRPKIGKAYERIKNKLGSSFLDKFTQHGYDMLDDIYNILIHKH